MKAPARDKDFIISFKEGDRAWGEVVGRVLKDAGYLVELRAWAYKDSEFFLEEVKQYASGGPTLVPVLTPAYMTTIHAEPKWFEGYQHGYFPVLPVLVKNCDIRSLLHTSHYVDWRYYDEEDSNLILVENAERQRGKPRNPPAQRVRPKVAAQPAGPSMASIKPVRRLPFEREELFTGRKAVLSEVEQALKQHHSVVIATAPDAPAGIGRRKLGIEFAYRHADRYKLIWGLRADHPAVLQDDFARLASTIGLPEQGVRDQAFTVQAVRRWLNRNPGWLLVFQNATDHDILRPYLPNPAMGHVLISSEKSIWPQVPATVLVRSWTEEEATRYVRRASGEEEDSYAPVVARELCCHTLSLKLGMRLMDRQGWTLSELCDELAVLRGSLSEYDDVNAPSSFALARVLCLALEAMQERDPEVIRFLKGFAYLHPFNIMPALLSSGAKALPRELARDVGNPETVERCVRLLDEFGIAEVRAGSLFVHPLVQARIRGWLEGSLSASIYTRLPGLGEQHSFSLARPSGPAWCKSALAVLRAVWPDQVEGSAQWDRCALLVPHAIAALEHADRLTVDTAAQENLWFSLGTYYLKRESFDFAYGAFGQALEGAEALHGSRHGHVTRALKGRGQAAAFLGRHEEAAECFRRLVDAEKGLLGGSSSPEVSEALVLLGDCYFQSERVPEALVCYEEALQRDKAMHKGSHPDLLRDFMLIGDAHRELGDLTRAWSFYEQAQLVKQALKTQSPKFEADLHWRLGKLHFGMGDLRNARSYLREAMTFEEQAEGQGSAALARMLVEMGAIEEELGNPADARRLYKKAMRIDEAIFGPEDVRVADHAERLARTAISLQQPAKARPALQRALEIYEATHGQDHLKTLALREALKKVS